MPQCSEDVISVLDWKSNIWRFRSPVYILLCVHVLFLQTPWLRPCYCRDMETISILLALCEAKSLVTHRGLVMRSWYVFFIVSPIKLWFETSWSSDNVSAGYNVLVVLFFVHILFFLSRLHYRMYDFVSWCHFWTAINDLHIRSVRNWVRVVELRWRMWSHCITRKDSCVPNRLPKCVTRLSPHGPISHSHKPKCYFGRNCCHLLH